MFRRSAADLKGAALRVHITSFFSVEDSAGDGGQMDSDNQGEPWLSEQAEILTEEEVEEEDQAPLPTTPKKSQGRRDNKSSRAPPDISSVRHTAMSTDESFPATIAVDRAMHLNLRGKLVTDFFFLSSYLLNQRCSEC